MSAALPFFLAVVALMATAVWWSWQQAKKRRALLAGFAASNGWAYVDEDDRWSTRFQGDPFGQGDNQRARNILQGTYRERPMVAFDYSFETHSTDSRGNRSTQTHTFGICALAMPAPLPTFQLTPESVLGRVGTMLGMQDIELESEDFNRRFRVRCEDPKLAYDVLPPRTMEALLARPALHVRLSGVDALCWENGAHSPSELLARLDTVATLLDGVPSYVWSDRKGTAP